jgi:hypothetical protein
MITEPDCGFADHPSLRSTAATVFASARNASCVIPNVNCLMELIASAISRKESDGSLKGKDCLVGGTLGNGLL